MKKMCAGVVILTGIWSAFGDNILMRDGTVFTNTVIIAADPVQMLIAHDNGGCQVAYKDLKPGTLTKGQKQAIEKGLKAYVERRERLEDARLKAEAKRKEEKTFEREQLAKGLVCFEGVWMKPAERQEVLAKRELARLKKKRAQAELEKEKANLRNQQKLLEQEKQKLQEYCNRLNHYTYSYRNSCTPSIYLYSYPGCCGNYYSYHHCKPGHHVSSRIIFSLGSDGSSIYIGSGWSSIHHHGSRDRIHRHGTSSRRHR